MDKTSQIVHHHNPGAEGKHPHQMQTQPTSNIVKRDEPETGRSLILIKLKDWKPGDLEMFASMGFSHDNVGDEGHYMEQDVLPNGDFEPQKFIRRVSRSKKHEWILEKRSIESVNEKKDDTYKVEKVFHNLIGNEKYPGLLDYFDGLSEKLTERRYLYPNMKLKTILESIPIKREEVSQYPQAENQSAVSKSLTQEQKRTLQTLVAEYNKYNEVLDARKNIVEVATKMTNIGELAEAYLVEKIHEGNKDENAWFDDRIVQKHVNEVKKYCSEFKKMASECDEKMRGMQGLYKETGMLLERYFNM